MLRGLILVFLTSLSAFSQCPTADFTISTTACRNTLLTPEATVANATSFSWDFCDGSVGNTPTEITSVTNSLITEPYDLHPFEQDGKHFFLSVNYNNGKILRYSFDNSHANTPTITDLGNFGVITRPLGVGLWKESNNVYALVATESGSFFRLDFGNSITNTPAVTQITGVSGLNDHRHIRITRDNGNVVALITGGTTRVLSVLNFGSSILNTPTRTFISIPSATFMTGLDIAIECNNRFAIVSGYFAGLYMLDFGNSFLNTPTVTQLTAVSETLVWGVSLVKSAGNYYGFFFSEASGIVRLDFGYSLTNTTPTATTLGKYSGIDLAIGLSIVKTGSSYFCASVNYTNGRLKVLQFPKSCSLDEAYVDELNPDGINYSTAGTRLVTLTAKGSNDEVITVTKPVTIDVALAPDLIITESGNCLANAISFAGSQQSGAPLNTLQWNFGDGNMASGQNAANNYASSGTYDVLLEATDANACSNRLIKSVPVYNTPIPDFDLPDASPICTNQLYQFSNTSTVDSEAPVTWLWRINNADESVDKDLSYTFLNAASQNVTLIASIPGCQIEKAETISSVIEGPNVDFSMTGHCQNEAVSFNNATTGSVTGFSWNFGDGQTATGTNVSKAFTSFGLFDVTLTAYGASGCNNTKTKSLTIRSQPDVNFYVSPPPFSCSGTPAKLNDLTFNPTDSNLETWHWDFGDPGSGQNDSGSKNPQHTYTTAGQYDVTLTVTTNFSCEATRQKTITISQTPVANFTTDAVCEDVAAHFTDSSTPVGSINAWSWQMGSSFYTGSNTATHTFANPGNVNAILSVTSSNGCMASVTKPLVVPAKLAPDFSVFKNCINQQTLFTDVTNDASDPITAQSWNFGGLGSGSGSPETFTFENTGNVNVTLSLLAESGCQYTRAKSISIAGAPTASFTATPEAGGPPLEVEFTNTSINATNYLWEFGDVANTTSTQTSESFTYEAMGDYSASLTAYNALNCSHKVTLPIHVLTALLEVAINGLQLIEFPDGSIRPAVTILNNGNVPVSNVGLILKMPGPVVLDRIPETIKAHTSYRHVFDFEFPSQYDGGYFCIEADVDDTEKNDNTACLSLDANFTVVAPHPNPAHGQLNLSWILKEDGIVNVEILNSMGQQISELRVDCQEGLTPLTLNTTGMGPGVYIVKIKYKQISRVYRVLISE